MRRPPGDHAPGTARVEASTRRTLYYWPSACARAVLRRSGPDVLIAPGLYETPMAPEPCCVRWLTRAQLDALRALYAAATPPTHLHLSRRCPGCGASIFGRAGKTYCHGPCQLRLRQRRARATASYEPEPPPPFDPWALSKLRPDLWKPDGVPEHLTPDALRALVICRTRDADPDEPTSPRFARRDGEGPGAYARRMATLAALEASPDGVAAPPARPTTSACDACGGRWTAQQWHDANGRCLWADCASNAEPPATP